MVTKPMATQEILILYYTRQGATLNMANFIARGVDSVDNMQARIRTVAPVSPITTATANTVPQSGAPYVSPQDFQTCIGLALGSPTRFGNMAAPLKHAIDQLSAVWLSGSTVNKPAGVFTSTESLHGGQETTLISMMLPLLHLGYVMVGLPFTEQALTTTTSGGTPYGPSHVASQGKTINETEKKLCLAFGKRLAVIAKRLAN